MQPKAVFFSNIAAATMVIYTYSPSDAQEFAREHCILNAFGQSQGNEIGLSSRLAYINSNKVHSHLDERKLFLRGKKFQKKSFFFSNNKYNNIL